MPFSKSVSLGLKEYTQKKEYEVSEIHLTID
jgi:hypothetical protein